jgi:hypothetical protein
MFRIKSLNTKNYVTNDPIHHFGITYWESEKKVYLDFGNYSLYLEWGFKNV